MRHRSDIEGLRAIAVVAALLYHFGVPGFEGGFVGVDIFFVISGYLITSLLLQERMSAGHISITRFYARRARRLLPISAVVIVVTVLAGAIWLPSTRLDNLAEEARAAALFAANLLFGDRGTDYLTAGLDPSPLQHYWSLAVEEQFYLLWPGLIALVTIGARNVRHRTAWVMGALVAGSFALSALLTESDPSWSYFGLHTRAWELGVGALLACLAPQVARLSDDVRGPIGWAGMMGIAVSVVTFGDVVVFPGWAAALPVLAAAAVLAAGDDTTAAPAIVLRLPPLQYLGSRSYSLYLWHWPVLIIAEGHLLRTLNPAERFAAIALTVALAELGYRFVEDPIRHSRRLARRPFQSLALGGALIAVGVVAAVAVAAYDPDESTGVVAAEPQLETPATTNNDGTNDDGTSATTTNEGESTTTTAPSPPSPLSTSDLPALAAVVDSLANDVVPDNLRPSLRSAAGDNAPIYDNSCHQFGARGVRTDCVFGDPNGEITIALWGDSHAAQWFTPLQQMATTHGWRLLSLTQGSCGFIDVTVYDKKNDREFGNCSQWREAVRTYMREQGVDVVFVSQHYGLLSADTKRTISPGEWEQHLPAVIDSLRADGIEPVLIGDSPDPDTTVPDCLATNRHRISSCAADQYNADDLRVVETIRAITSARTMGFVEPGEWICSDDGRCPAVIGDILVYRDGNHLTETVAAWMAPLVDQLIAPFVGDWVDYRDAE